LLSIEGSSRASKEPPRLLNDLRILDSIKVSVLDLLGFKFYKISNEASLQIQHI